MYHYHYGCDWQLLQTLAQEGMASAQKALQCCAETGCQLSLVCYQNVLHWHEGLRLSCAPSLEEKAPPSTLPANSRHQLELVWPISGCDLNRQTTWILRKPTLFLHLIRQHADRRCAHTQHCRHCGDANAQYDKGMNRTGQPLMLLRGLSLILVIRLAA